MANSDSLTAQMSGSTSLRHFKLPTSLFSRRAVREASDFASQIRCRTRHATLAMAYKTSGKPNTSFRF